MASTADKPSERTYIGVRDEDGNAFVFISLPDQEWSPLPLSPFARSKSAGGFEWGYGGSGPSALAHSILVYELHASGRTAAEADKIASSQGMYHDFKDDKIVPMPREGSGEQWRLTSTQIQDWLQARRWFDAMHVPADE